MVRGGTILHICSDYAHQRIYAELFASLHDSGLEQVVYAPVRTAAELEVPGPPRPRIRFHARHILRAHHRVFFGQKVRTVAADVSRVAKPAVASLVHAHFLYSDGAVALRLHENFGIPYVTAVRNTDLNVFMRLRPDLRGEMHRIASQAQALVFLSPVYREQFLSRIPNAIARNIADRCHVIPNGIEDLWHETPPPRKSSVSMPLRILYVGNFTTNKNVPRLLEAAARLRARYPITVTLVGGGGDGAETVHRLLATTDYSFARAAGHVEDRGMLRDIYREHDVFAMPSLRETFGVVYIEALSQGIPVLLSRGQGVDGYFESGTITEVVNPLSVSSIELGLERLAARAGTQRDACVSAAQAFAWPAIATTYRALYTTVASGIGTA